MTASWPLMLGALNGIYSRLGNLEMKFTVNVGSKTLVNEVRTGLELGGNLDV
jgi:hypothetical protein